METALSDLIRREADQCVKCGLCLPHCPTYGLSRDEGESPRGRIALLQALAEERLGADGRLAEHIDHCLGCRACERVCPSQVKYGRLIEAGRALIGPASDRRPATGLAGAATRRMLAGKGLGRTAAALLRAYQKSGLQWILRRTPLLDALGLRRADGLLPPLASPARLRSHYPPAGTPRGEVGLFTGCMGPALEPAALRAAIALLNAAGYGVRIPDEQGCCGAMHRHAGDPAAAEGLARKNVAAFNALGIDAIAWVASGCGAALAEYAAWDRESGANVPAFRAEPVDLCSLLDRLGIHETLSFRPLTPSGGGSPARPARVLVHEPCSLRNVVRAQQATYRLLGRIPGITVEPLPENGRCCGGAGAYLVKQPGIADALGSAKAEIVRETRPDIVVTSNTGCAIQLARAVREAGLRIRVVHPAVLLHEQLQT